MQEILTINGDLSIRKMQDAAADYKLMLKWLTDERVLEHYEGRDKKFTVDSIKEKYSPRTTGKDKVTPCIIEYEGKPIGYIQFYPDPEPDEVFGNEKNVFGIDLFIGEPEFWSKGLGSTSLRMLVEYLFANTNAVKIVIDPDVDNTRAIRAYEKAGFRKVKIIAGYEPHEGKIPDAWLMVCEK